MAINILVISGYYHDSAAALLRDGVILAAGQQERFICKKHDPGFPAHGFQAWVPDLNDHWPMPGLDQYREHFINYVLSHYPVDRAGHLIVRQGIDGTNKSQGPDELPRSRCCS